MKRAPILSIRWFLFFALLFSLQVLPRLGEDSLMNDEPGEITNGVAYLRYGDVWTHHRHPPLATAWQALPLVILGIETPNPMLGHEDRGFEYFFVRQGSLDLKTLLPRGMTLLAGWGVIFLLFLAVRRRTVIEALSVLTLACFEPTLLAFSGYAMADVPVTFLLFASVLAFEAARREGGVWRAAGAGALVAMAVCSKFSALVLIPILLVLEFSEPNSKGDRRALRQRLTRWVWGIGAFLLGVALVYLPGTLVRTGHPDPFHLFTSGLLDLMRYNAAHHPVYFMGEASASNHLLYYPIAFLLKTPLPLLLLVLAAVILRVVGRREAWMWVPPLAVLLAVIPVQNLGVRYLLPAFPFVILLAGRAAAWCWEAGRKRHRVWRGAILGLLAWQVLSVISSWPGHLSYFNEAVPKSRRAWWLGDSNLDMGHDLKRLARIVRLEGWKEVRLAYLGPADPTVYGLPWRRWTESDLEAPQPGRIYAVHAAFFQMAPAFFPETYLIANGWACQRAPTRRVGETFYLYVIPGKPEGSDDSPPVPSVPYLKY